MRNAATGVIAVSGRVPCWPSVLSPVIAGGSRLGTHWALTGLVCGALGFFPGFFSLLTTAAHAQGAPSGYEHFWCPEWRESFSGYESMTYNAQANECLAVIVEGGIALPSSTIKLTTASSGPAGGPQTNDPIMPVPASASGTGFIFGAQGSLPLIDLSPPLIVPGLLLSPPPAQPSQQVMYAPEAKPASGFPTVIPTKAPPKPQAPLPRITFNAEAGIYGFAGGSSTVNGIPGGPGITPTGTDSFNFRDNFMVTAGGAIVVPVTASLTAAVTGGFAGVDKTVTFNCVTYCQFPGAPVPTFSASKDVFLPGAYVGGRVQWPIAISGLPGAAVVLQYRHVFAFNENVSLGSVAQGRIVSFNVSQDLNLVTAGLSIPFGRR